MRLAIYHTPAPDSRFAALAANWLGRDAFTDRPARPADARLDPIVAEPARYGFHATLKAPFRPRDGVGIDEVDRRLAAFAAGRRPARIERLALARLGSFFALVPAGPEPSLARLEAETLAAFEPFRAPLNEAETARRGPERLNDRQRAYLAAWGYPYVLDEFCFHMTLTGPTSEPTDALHRRIEAHFAPVLGRPYDLAGLALFVEPEPGAPFRAHSYHPFEADPAPHEPQTP